MTAKEALRELVDELPEDEAAEWLARIRSEMSNQTAENVWDIFERAARRIPPDELEKMPPIKPIWEIVRELASDIPDEVLARMPSSDRIDEVVYRLHRDQ